MTFLVFVSESIAVQGQTLHTCIKGTSLVEDFFLSVFLKFFNISKNRADADESCSTEHPRSFSRFSPLNSCPFNETRFVHVMYGHYLVDWRLSERLNRVF